VAPKLSETAKLFDSSLRALERGGPVAVAPGVTQALPAPAEAARDEIRALRRA
jgi:hypothetical protein